MISTQSDHTFLVNLIVLFGSISVLLGLVFRGAMSLIKDVVQAILRKVFS